MKHGGRSDVAFLTLQGGLNLQQFEKLGEATVQGDVKSIRYRGKLRHRVKHFVRRVCRVHGTSGVTSPQGRDRIGREASPVTRRQRPTSYP